MDVPQGIKRWLRTPEGRQAQRFLARAAAEEGIRRGLLTSAATDAELVQGIKALIRSLDTAPIKIVIEHETELLAAARQFAEDEAFELACLCYATWTEHWLNFAVRDACHKLKWDAREIEELIRQVNVKAKTTWLFRLLGLKSLPETHRRAMNELAELRNWYVHYKWMPEVLHEPNEQRERIQKAVGAYPATVRYLTRYRGRYITGGRKALVKRVLKLRGHGKTSTP